MKVTGIIVNVKVIRYIDLNNPFPGIGKTIHVIRSLESDLSLNRGKELQSVRKSCVKVLHVFQGFSFLWVKL